MIGYVDGDGMCHKQAGLHSSKCFAHILTIDKATKSVILEPKHTHRAENPSEKPKVSQQRFHLPKTQNPKH
jgi:hypothetical protein